jgi:hypothetical protein
MKILSDKELWKKIMNEQIDEFINKFYGYKNISSLINFIKETSYFNNKLLILNNYTNEVHKIWFINNIIYTNSFYSVIMNNEDIKEAMIKKKNYIIYPNENYDMFLIEELLTFSDYNIYLDLKVKNKQLIIDICNKYNKKYKIKNPIKVFCLISEAGSGSTLLVDFLQKNSKNILALSEIFFDSNNFNLFDVKNNSGILKEFKIKSIDDYYSNISDYFKQFEDIANFKDYEIIFFELTLDYNLPIEKNTNLDLYLNFIKKFNIIHFERNLLECYISKKIECIDVNIDDFSKYINNIPNDIFKLNEYYEFTKNMEIYNEYIFKPIHNYYKINYALTLKLYKYSHSRNLGYRNLSANFSWYKLLLLFTILLLLFIRE